MCCGCGIGFSWKVLFIVIPCPLKCGGDWLSVVLMVRTWACCWFGICWMNYVEGGLFGVTVMAGWWFVLVVLGGGLRLAAGGFFLLLLLAKAS